MTIIARTPAVPKLNALLNSSSGTFIWRAGGVSPLILPALADGIQNQGAYAPRSPNDSGSLSYSAVSPS